VPHAVKRIADALLPEVTCQMVDAQAYWAYTTPVPSQIDLREPQPIDLREPQPIDLREAHDVRDHHRGS
jgi:hypothetical protein